jgi:cobalt transporter subunit CbtB
MRKYVAKSVAAQGYAQSTVRLAALLAMMFGLAMIWTVGFAAPTLIHNSAHDSRHTFAFPCH